MTYQRLFDLKFREAVPTYELGRRYPKEKRKISRVALLELPITMLRQLVKQKKELQKLTWLREWLLKKDNGRKQSNSNGVHRKRPSL